MNLGLRFKLLRVSAGLKQREVAEALNVTTNYVSMIERSKREPTLDYLRRFAKVVGVPASLLLWEVDEVKDVDEHAKTLRNRVSALMAEFAAVQGIQ
jgi:transcriptional regulator with XRE-family HTH domain